MYNKCDSFTSGHKITVDMLTKLINLSKLYWLISTLLNLFIIKSFERQLIRNKYIET